MKRAPDRFTEASELSLLDVFVIGSHAHEQLNRFFKIAKIFANTIEFNKSTDKMELAEFNGNGKAMVSPNGTFGISPHQQIINNQQSQNQQLPHNQIAVNPHIFRNHNQPQQPGLRHANNSRVVEHRELPVDVPDSFVGIAKQSPRYPPPKPHRQVSPPMPVGSMTTFNSNPSTVRYNSNGQNTFAQQSAIHPITQSTAANIISHNSSLRSSIKLKQLEKSRCGQHGNFPAGQMQPAINQAFELNEDDITTPGSQAMDPNSPNRSKHSMLDLRAIYSRLERNLNGEFAGVSSDVKLAKLVSIYDTIVQTHDKQFKIPPLTSRHISTMNAQGNPEPVTFKVLELLRSVLHLFEGDMMTEDVAELLAILCKHEVGAVCSAFDRIAQSFEFAKLSRPSSPPNVEMVTENSPQSTNLYLQKPNAYQMHGNHMDGYEYTNDQVHMDIENNLYQNSLHPLTEIDLSDGTRTKTVCIEKACHQPLGATIKNDSDNCVLIGRIVYGGAAHRSGLLHEGDELVEVNGIGMRGKNVNDVVNILESMPNGTLTCTVLTRNYNKPAQRNLQEKILVKAFFRYEADKDDYIPCKELGLSFERGEILTIIDQSDPKWWQAYREDAPPDCQLASLIPSINFLKQRERDTEHEDFTTLNYKQERKNLVSFLMKCPKGSSAKRRKKPTNFPFGPEEIQYYEEVGTYYPKECGKRPIILVGPKNIGQREIVARLLQDKNRFASAISHTSRRREEGERDSVNYHFVSRAEFEARVKSGEFIEFGLYQNEYYGTTLNAMKEVVKANKTCIHLVNTTSIFNFRQGRAGSELKPFFVFVKPDDSYPEKLKNIVTKYSSAKSNIENNIKAAVEEIELIETHYLPYFDMVLTVTDVDRAYQKLLSEITKIEEQPSWIPKFWDQQ